MLPVGRVREVVFQSLQVRASIPCTKYCAVCGVLLYPEETAFVQLDVNQYLEMRPFYCSLLGSGTWRELISNGIERRSSSTVTMAPQLDENMEAFLEAIPSADPDEPHPRVYVLTCKQHRRYNADLRRDHMFYKEHLNPGFLVQGPVLPELKLKLRSYLAPILVYTELRRPSYVRTGNMPPVKFKSFMDVHGTQVCLALLLATWRSLTTPVYWMRYTEVMIDHFVMRC
jgi:hypothetical protein